ncbi:MAG TPA: hypothetical protein VK151_01195 [Fluviicola sp.]|nr:hypothetical protein [Fluviicola sp.]
MKTDLELQKDVKAVTEYIEVQPFPCVLRSDAEKTAGNAPHVTCVENLLEVKIPSYAS